MPVTTVLSDDTATIVSDGEAAPFSWSALRRRLRCDRRDLFCSRWVGRGLRWSPSPRDERRAATFSRSARSISCGQAFGFAAGGHIVGRLIGPALETDREEKSAPVHGCRLGAAWWRPHAGAFRCWWPVRPRERRVNGALASTSAAARATAPPHRLLGRHLFRPSIDASSAGLAPIRASRHRHRDRRQHGARPTTLTPDESAGRDRTAAVRRRRRSSTVQRSSAAAARPYVAGPDRRGR